jgi:hypothetical protein
MQNSFESQDNYFFMGNGRGKLRYFESFHQFISKFIDIRGISLLIKSTKEEKGGYDEKIPGS